MTVKRIVYDTETYLNCFLLCAEDAESDTKWSFEISPWKDESRAIIDWMNSLQNAGTEMIGFNCLGFDYPIIHMLYRMGKATPKQLYDKAMAIINSPDRFSHLVFPSDRVVRQIDLFKIHHFDNAARSTSLKALEFNMRLANIHDLPFSVGIALNKEQIEVLREYCAYDVTATKLFYKESLPAIKFREQLVGKYSTDVMNASDVKLGKIIFQGHLESQGVQCYTVGPEGRIPKQTPRPVIRLADCIPPYIKFNRPEFQSIKEQFENKVITETKGAFKDASVKVDGLKFVFGTGGIHASVETAQFIADDDMMILDVDVTSMYPSIAIENNLYPEHLGSEFVNIYRKLRTERNSHPKGSVENAALKLALNGTYGASGDKFSIFYDPLFTMRITVAGQLVLAMLIERLLEVSGVQIIQANTDGVTMFMPRIAKFQVDMVCAIWEQDTRLTLEQVEYKQMSIADVNSYHAVKLNGEVKRKGRYEFDLEWHKDASALVIPKVTEQVLLTGIPVKEALMAHTDLMDFMLRVKVPRSSRLVIQDRNGERDLENTQRYYVSEGGGALTKIMPPHPKKPGVWRRFAVCKGRTVCPCNDLNEVTLPIDYSWYESEIETLTYGVM